MLADELRVRAERFLPACVRARIYNPQVRPHWIGDSDRFWYRRESPDGITIMVVDAETGRVTPAEDPAALAAEPEPDPSGEVRSPDRMHAAFCRGPNLWVRELGSGFERQLTFDGARHHAYTT